MAVLHKAFNTPYSKHTELNVIRNAIKTHHGFRTITQQSKYDSNFCLASHKVGNASLMLFTSKPRSKEGTAMHHPERTAESPAPSVHRVHIDEVWHYNHTTNYTAVKRHAYSYNILTTLFVDCLFLYRIASRDSTWKRAATVCSLRSLSATLWKGNEAFLLVHNHSPLMCVSALHNHCSWYIVVNRLQVT